MIRKALAFAIGFGLLSSAYATQWSAGGGAFLGSYFGGGVKASFFGMTLLEINYPHTGGGFYGFVDGQYVEFSGGLTFAGGKMDVKSGMGDLFGGGGWDDDDDDFDLGIPGVGDDIKTSFTFLNFGLLLKYPIEMSESMTLFPAAGINYSHCMSAKLKAGGMEEEAEDSGDLSRLWFKFGGGADFELSEKMYLRTTLLYGIGMKNKLEKDLVDMGDGLFNTVTQHGIDIKAGIGFKF